MSTQALLDKLIQPDWWAALLVAALFALLVRAARLLTLSGAVATFIVGFVTFGLGGGKFTVPLLTFFFTSSLLSRVGRRLKAGADARTAKGATRDYAQVLANGGAATIIVLLFWLTAHRWPIEQTRTLLMLYLAALATVNADTWATEIGGLSRSAPRLLSNWKRAPTGASGAVTALGLAAALAGSFVVTGAGWLVWRLSPPEFIAVCWAGFLGSFIDSLLGASVQALYRHPVTGEFTERTVVEGVKTVKARGIAWMNNDVVNFLASAGGILCAWLLLRYCAYSVR
jgi:uncharacterized protein (TIGR00297 family)